MAALAAKRKRDVNDMPNPRAAPNIDPDFETQYLHEDAMNHHDNDMAFATALTQHNTDVGDAGELHHDHTQQHPQDDMHEPGGQSASDTAAAAMAQYHTMTVPQSTESAFMTQAGDQGERPTSSSIDHGSNGGQHRTSSFGDFDMPQNPPGANGNTSPTAPGHQGKSSATPKPQVGTEEWHKVRKDNHKEGSF